MLGLAVLFFGIAVVAILFGLGSVNDSAAGIAQVLFFVSLALVVLSLLAASMPARPTRTM